MIRTPTNATVSIERKSTVIQTGVPALILPARPEISMTREVPASKAFEVFFREVVEVKEQDFLIRSGQRYKVIGVAHYDTPRAAHTEVVAEGLWGTD